MVFLKWFHESFVQSALKYKSLTMIFVSTDNNIILSSFFSKKRNIKCFYY